jgi:hypothetical protein
MFNTIQDLETYVNTAFPDNDDELIEPQHVRDFANGVVEFLKKVFDPNVFKSDEDAKAFGHKIGDIYLLHPDNEFGYPAYSFRTIKS